MSGTETFEASPAVSQGASEGKWNERHSSDFSSSILTADVGIPNDGFPTAPNVFAENYGKSCRMHSKYDGLSQIVATKLYAATLLNTCLTNSNSCCFFDLASSHTKELALTISL